MDPFSGYRLYAPELLVTAARVHQLRDVGLSVAELPRASRCSVTRWRRALLVRAVVPDAASLDRLVRRLKSEAGVAQTSTRLAMSTPR